MASSSRSSAKSSLASMTLRIFFLFDASGKLTINLQKHIPEIGQSKNQY
jgi:hypothetical protein